MKIILFLGLILIRVQSIHAQTEISDTLIGILKTVHSPFVVTGNIVVPDGKKLQIQPGVEIQFAGHYQIIVQGSLQAEGKSDSMILFTRQYPLDQYTWKGIRFMEADADSRLEYCIIEYGESQYPDYQGGGIYCRKSSPVIRSCVIQKNHAYAEGGGIACYYSSPLIQDNQFSNNLSGLEASEIDQIPGKGGAIYCYHSSPLIIGNRIVKNTVGFEGSFFGGDGGGIYLDSGSYPLIVQNIIYDNRAIDMAAAGGGIFSVSHGVRIYNNVIYQNNCRLGGGGGIYADSSTDICNCIIMKNAMVISGIISIPDQVNPGLGLTYSNIEDGYQGAGNINLDPLFIDPTKLDFHLQSGSPCIDAGNPDQVFHDKDQSRNDMGAFGGFYNATWTSIPATPVSPDSFYSILEDLKICPNPVQNQADIHYYLFQPAQIKVTLYNLISQETATIFHGYSISGHHVLHWNSFPLSSGLYIWKLETCNEQITLKCIIVH